MFFGENCRYDWARKIPGRVSDAMKKIVVGTGENYDGEQVLLIKHFYTEVKYDTNSSWPNHPPVWGIGFSASELLEVQKGVIEKLETCGTFTCLSCYHSFAHHHHVITFLTHILIHTQRVTHSLTYPITYSLTCN